MSELPVHPRTGLRALGVLRSGRVIWPVMGAEDPPPTDPPADPLKPDTPPPTPPPTDPPPDDKTDWKAEARKWEQRAKENRDKAKKLDELETANKSELEKTQQKADEADAKVRTATERAVKAEVRALADDFADRDDAPLNLGDLTRFVGEDSEIDTRAIKAELKSVLDRKPHLKKPDTPAPPNPRGRPVPDLKPGGDPNAPPKAGRLEDALAAHYNET